MVEPIERYMTRSPITIDRHASLAKAHGLMLTRDIGHLPVMHRGTLVGVVSCSELRLIEMIGSLPLEAIEIDEAMSATPYVVSLGEPVDRVVEAMVQHKHGCAIVMNDEGDVVGIFTTTDAMTLLAKHLQAA